VAPLDAADAKDDALISSGNLVAPPPDDAGADAAKDAADEDVFIGSGNLVPPPDSGGD
jgi:predicted TIM-barrel enzyme